MRLARSAAIGLITLYQHTLSPDHGPLRRLFPRGVCVHREETCSVYGKRVIREHGARRGIAMVVKRVWGCR